MTTTRPTPPEPRSGAWRFIDEFIGPGATKSELVLQLAPLPFAFYFGWMSATSAGYGVGRSFAAAVLALDLIGGIATNSTNAAKRWYHRDGQGVANHMGFVVPHVGHIFLVAWLFRVGGTKWLWAFVVAMYLLVAAMIICLVDRKIQRTVALLCFAIATWIDVSSGGAGRGVEWFVPLLFLKLLVAHLVDEIVFDEVGDVDEHTPIA